MGGLGQLPGILTVCSVINSKSSKMKIFSKILNVAKYLLPKNETKIEAAIKQILKNNWVQKTGKCVILIEGLLETPVSIIEKSRIAKAIEEKNGGVSYAVLKGFYSRSNRTSFLFQAMGVHQFINWWSICIHPYVLLKALGSVLNIFKNNLTGSELLSIYHGKILIGDLIYDSIIRHNPGTYTIDKINGVNAYRIIFRSYMALYANEIIIKLYKPTHLVTSHMVYAEFGLLARQAASAGCEVHLKDMSVYYKYKDNSRIYDHYLSVNQSDFDLAQKDVRILEESRLYFDQRFSGNINELDVKNAFHGKRNYTKEELLFKYTGSERNNKLNIVVFAHAFSDAPHVGMGMIFKDYFEWLNITLSELSQVEKYNIFVKEHPGSYLYGESGVVEHLIGKIGNRSIFILPSDLNTSSVRELCDVVITAQGTAGLEFTALGKPVLTAGETYYSKHGISNAAKNRLSYIECLHNLDNLKVPSEEEKKRALLHLYLTFSKLIRSEVLPKTEILPGDNYLKLYDKSLHEFFENLEKNYPIKDKFYKFVMSEA